MVPAHRAKLAVALAATGMTPVNRSAGKAMKLPPPTTELSAPPTAADPKSNTAEAGVTRDRPHVESGLGNSPLIATAKNAKWEPGPDQRSGAIVFALIRNA